MPAPTVHQPVTAVLFDLHGTLVDQGDAEDWLAAAESRCGHPSPVDERAELIAFLDRVWEHARVHDPGSERDLSPARHQAVYEATMKAGPTHDVALRHALYETLLDSWVAYSDAVPVLTELREAGIGTALVSNVGVDVTEVLRRNGLLPLLDVVVTSHEVGAVKPDPRIFAVAVEQLGVAPGRALMVGDTAADDAGGSVLGIRTLVLPRTRGPVHGLELVARICSPPSV